MGPTPCNFFSFHHTHSGVQCNIECMLYFFSSRNVGRASLVLHECHYSFFQRIKKKIHNHFYSIVSHKAETFFTSECTWSSEVFERGCGHAFLGKKKKKKKKSVARSLILSSPLFTDYPVDSWAPCTVRIRDLDNLGLDLRPAWALFAIT